MINLGHNSLAVHGIVVITQVDYAFFFFFCDVPVAQVKNEISETKIYVSVPRKNFRFRMRANFEMEGFRGARGL